ncbi:MAG: TVP38/TMEM64 family protein [Promethearchaeota archaeon]|nr:MAG: TVP38/TMEM64 family protein [Candidatus Lokiarchaeota archaeon]
MTSQDQEKESFSEKLKAYIKNLLDFSQYDTKTILYIILFAFLVVVSLGLLYYVYFTEEGETFLYELVVIWFVNPIYALGFFGILLFLIIMAIQGLLVPIPSEIVLLASGMIWGFWLGGLMGILGSMAAGILCFYISKRGGRPLAEKFVGESALEMADDFIHKYGMGAIIIARFLPFVAFDPISYASGLVDMDTKKYALGTLIGSIPRAFFYAFLGASLGIKPPVNIEDLDPAQFRADAQLFNNILLIILVVLSIMFALYYLISKRYEKAKNLPVDESVKITEKESQAKIVKNKPEREDPPTG